MHLRPYHDLAAANQTIHSTRRQTPEASVLHFNKRHEFVSAVALLAACAFSTSCTAWHPISLQPQQFSADTSPEWVRVTLRDSTRFTASHPVLVGDSLVWIDWGDANSRDSTRSTVLTSSIQRAEVRRADTTGTIVLLVFVAGAVGGLFYFVHYVVPRIGGN
jgi:hypothetical protein